MALYKRYQTPSHDNSDVLLEDEWQSWQILTKPSYYKGLYPSIIERARCISNRHRDGIWDEASKRWKIPPCKRKNCRRHWRIYAKRKYHLLKAKFPTYKHWRSIRLSCKCFLQQGRRFTQLERFRNKVNTRHPGATLACIYHRGRTADHIHCLLGTDHYVDDQFVRKAWKAHFPAKRLMDWKPQFVCCKDHNSPTRWLWYCLMGRKEKPRVKPPWMGIPMRSPIKWFN